MGNGQWAMASQPASQWEIWRSGGRFPAVRARLPQGPKCKGSRKTHIETTFGDPGSNPESTRNRFKIDPKSTPGPPGAPRGSARAIPDAFSGPRPPPEAYRAPPGGPKIGLGKRSRLAGGGPGAISGAPRARRERSARAARAILGPSRHPRGPKRRSGAILVRFPVDFGSIFGLFVEFLRRCSRSSCVKGRPRVRIACSHTKRSSDLSRARREATENRPKIAAGALPERVARKIAENRPKSSKVGPEIDPAALGKAASGPSGRLCGSPGVLGGAR